MANEKKAAPAEKKAAIELDGKSYLVEQLPPDVQRLVDIYRVWTEELQQAEVERFKLDAAIRSLTIEIKTRIEKVSAQPVK